MCQQNRKVLRGDLSIAVQISEIGAALSPLREQQCKISRVHPSIEVQVAACPLTRVELVVLIHILRPCGDLACVGDAI